MYVVTVTDPNGNRHAADKPWSAERLAAALEVPVADLPEEGSGRDLKSARQGSPGWMLRWRRAAS